MKIELELSNMEYEAIKFKAASLLLDTSPSSIVIVARSCIVELLALEDRLDRTALITQIMDEKKPELPTNGLIEAAKARQTNREKKRIVLELPAREWNGNITTGWKVFCWLARTMLDQKKWHSFIADNPSQDGAISKKNAYDGIYKLVKLGWIYESGTQTIKTKKSQMTVNAYSVTEAGKTWLTDRANQIYLIGEGIIAAPKQDQDDE